jgi:hypothetical protein
MDAPAVKRLKTDTLPQCCTDAASAATALHAKCLRSCLGIQRETQRDKQQVKQRSRNAQAIHRMLLRMCSSPRAAVVGTEQYACVQAIIEGGFADWTAAIRAAAVRSYLPALKALLAAAPGEQHLRLAQCAISSSCCSTANDEKQRSTAQRFVDYAITEFRKAGGDFHAVMNAGCTLLHESVLKSSGGSSIVRKALLATVTEAASMQQQQQCSLLAQQDANDCTALHLAVGPAAAAWHNAEALADLLSHSSAAALSGALPKQDKEGRSVLHYAISKSSDADGQLQKLLLKCNELGVPSAVLRIRDYQGADAVCCARRDGNSAVLSLLQQHGVREVRRIQLDTNTQVIFM